MGTFLGVISAIRHGVTLYTNEFPDIVEDSAVELRILGEKISKQFAYEPVFFSSPAERALGTTMYLMRGYGIPWSQKLVLVEEMFGPIKIYDSQKMRQLVEEISAGYTEQRQIMELRDKYYLSAPHFNENHYWEPRDSAKFRFYNSLRMISAVLKVEKNKEHAILVSHLETIGTALKEWFDLNGEDRPYLKPGGVAHFYVYEGKGDCHYNIRIEFNNEERLISI
jgi:broad specificity phosphatase PhoE